MQFDLTDLRLFVLAAEHGNITRAAAAQHLSLAAASARIKALEAQAGLPLLYREARGVRLTPPGEAFLHHARGVLHQAEQLRRDLHDYGGGLRGHVRVFANTTAVTDFLPEVLPGFLAANPRVNVDLQEKPNAEIARGVLDGRADVGIVAGAVDTLGLQVIHFSTDRLVLVTPREHRFARRKQIPFAETLQEDMVGMHHGSTLQSFLEQQAEKIGKPMRLRIQLGSFDAMCRMVGGGVGVAIVPESAARRNLKPQKLAQIELADAWRVRERYIVVRDREALPAYARALIDRLCEHFKRRPAKPRPAI
ncbi:LysR family transcriptional regulator [Ramlibacter albus]|uniref:LysR family transcriptional regulator n=1 Tax=Ramlibacter albus TaxID=2079448 RepID=A0A923M8R7_9BURK|nr:LysR family transcriptional regulator [Ramlibacter albus]MBC5765766.1 LysR family transcriptional regulator [Ramlibacter albus]